MIQQNKRATVGLHLTTDWTYIITSASITHIVLTYCIV